MKKNLYFSLLLLLTAGCSTVTMNPKGQTHYISEPTFEKSLPFFIGGIVGKGVVDAKEVCGTRQIRQIQTQETFLDSFLGIITFSIYTPETVKIWCEEKGA